MDGEELDQEVSRLGRAREFWEGSARWDAHRAIFDGPEEEFDTGGDEHARQLAAFVLPGARVVDLGCGIGRVMRPLAPHCGELIGFDISEEMIEKGQEYLRGTPGARLVRTDGATLPGVEDASVGFLYSLLCFIHVDKRLAYRYFREIERVLVPEGVVHLQFENILSDEGLAEFRRVVDHDGEYPLEFYTREEAVRLLASVGLETAAVRHDRQFIYVTAVKGSAVHWTRAYAEGIELEAPTFEGCLVDGGGLAEQGRVSASAVSSLQHPVAVTARVTISSDAPGPGLESVCFGEGVLHLEPGATRRIDARLRPGADGFELTVDGAPVPWALSGAGAGSRAGRLAVHLTLCPPGFALGDEFLERFPGLHAVRGSGS